VHTADREQFLALLDTCADVFGKPKLDDLKAQVYWRALRDLSLERVRHGVEMHLRFGKFFPKPRELRPTDDKPPREVSPQHEATIQAAERAACVAWDELRRRDPQRFAYEIGMARAARSMAGFDESSPIYAEALQQLRHFTDLRNAAWERARIARRGTA